MHLDADTRETLNIRARRSGLTMDQVWMSSVVLVAVGVALASRMLVVDLAYHIRLGNSILSGGGLPHVDTFTFSAAGRAWVDQQWGAQVVLAAAFRNGGWAGVAFLHACLIGVTFWLLSAACRKRGASPRVSATLALCGLTVCFLNMGMRPQTFAYPLFAASLFLVADRRTHPSRFWLLPVIAGVWANMHGSFVLAPVLVGLASIEDLHDRVPRSATTLKIGAATLLATLANPFGVGAWRYALSISTNSRIVGQFQEWEATSLRTFAGALFFVSAIAIAGYLSRRKDPVDRATLIWLGTFFLLGLSALRGVVWWGLVFPFVVAGLVRNERKGGTSSDRRGSSMLNAVMLVAVIGFAAVQLPWWRDQVDPTTGASRLVGIAPQHLVDATRRSVPPNARLFVTQGFASWFEFALPSHPVFVDSRIELFPDRVWDDYLRVMSGSDGWQEILDRWRVDSVVLGREDRAILQLITGDSGWRLAYRDAQGALFIRA